MLSLEKDYARLEIPAGDDFQAVSESIRMLFQLCRLNNLPGALIVSLQGASDWRSCMRLGIRFSASRGTLLESRLALVVQGAKAREHDDVYQVAHDAGLMCRIFEEEQPALAWLDEGKSALRIATQS